MPKFGDFGSDIAQHKAGSCDDQGGNVTWICNQEISMCILICKALYLTLISLFAQVLDKSPYFKCRPWYCLFFFFFFVLHRWHCVIMIHSSYFPVIILGADGTNGPLWWVLDVEPFNFNAIMYIDIDMAHCAKAYLARLESDANLLHTSGRPVTTRGLASLVHIHIPQMHRL